MNAAHLIQSILRIASAPPAVILVFKHLVTVYFLRGFSFFVFFSFFFFTPPRSWLTERLSLRMNLRLNGSGVLTVLFVGTRAEQPRQQRRRRSRCAGVGRERSDRRGSSFSPLPSVCVCVCVEMKTIISDTDSQQWWNRDGARGEVTWLRTSNWVFLHLCFFHLELEMTTEVIVMCC